jgi:hypothetical protein
MSINFEKELNEEIDFENSHFDHFWQLSGQKSKYAFMTSGLTFLRFLAKK